MAAPAGTSPEIVGRLNVALNEALKDKTVGDRLRRVGIEVVNDSTPASTRVFVEADIAKWRAGVELAGAKVDCCRW